MREESKKTKGPEEDSQNMLRHLCLMEESKKTKGPEEDRKKRLRPPMSDGGEEEDQRTLRG